MPLAYSKHGAAAVVRRISGGGEVRKRLEAMGFVVGEKIAVVSELAGSIIVNVKGSRIALNRELAARIFVSG